MISAKVVNANTNNSDNICRFIATFFPYHKVSHSQITNNILTGKHFYLLAISEGKTIGFIDVAVRKNSAIILGMAVEAKFRNNGVGTILLHNALTRIRYLGLNITYLLVQTTNVSAIELYLANGFVFRRVSKVLVGGKEAYLMVRRETD